MFVSIFFFLILLTITIRFWWRNTVHGKAAYKLKNYTGPPALPVIGNLPQLFPFKPGYKKYFPWYDKYESPMRVRFGPMNEVHIFQADHVEVNILDEKHAVPVGTVVRVNIAKVHLDPRYFPDPLTYNPDRFLDYTFRNQQPFAFIPFSAGVRNCIGQKFAMLELKMVMALVLTKFSIEAVEPEDTIDPVSCVILRPSKGVMVKLSQR